MDKKVEQARRLIAGAQSICILTGAGISAESGLGTFRDAGGLWEKHRIEDVATPEGFAKDPKLVWRFYNARRKAADVATPNPAHLVLARLEAGRDIKTRRKRKSEGRLMPPTVILTQNIDGLHQQAGSVNVVELHGSIWKLVCTKCGAVSEDFPIEVPILPKCASCGSLMRPAVVWFGEALNADILEQADEGVRACDLFIVVGTSAVVQPAASYPFFAAARGVPVIEVNKERTSVSALAEVSLQGLAGEILPKLV